MKKFLSLVMLALLSIGAWASEITINMNNVDLSWTAVGDDQQTTSQGITIYYAKGGSSTPTSQGLTANHIRFYKNSTVTISAASAITKIVFTAVSGYDASNFTPDVGTNTAGTWTGSATEITFTMAAQVRVSKMVVTLDDGIVATPYFSPDEGTFYGPTDVTIYGQEGATIYYTLNGTNPSTSSSIYSNPFTVSETTTVKAIATLNGNSSAVATATYTIESAPTVANIAAFSALEDNTIAAFSNPVVVTYANGKWTFVKDETGFLCIFGSEISGKYKQGDVIPAGFGGVKTIYNNGVEMKSPLFGFLDTDETENVEADEVTVANFGNCAMWQYVVIRNASITYNNGRYLGIRVDNSTDSVVAYNQFNLTLPDLDATYDIYGIVTSYNGNIQMYPIEFVDTNPIIVSSIAELLALESGKNATITGAVTAIYHSGKQLYIKDETAYMQVYGTLSNIYNNGDQLIGITGNWVTHNGMTEIIPIASSFGDATPGTPVEPEVLPIEEIDQSMIHHYLHIENCSIDSIEGSNGRNFTLADETGDIVMRLSFNEITIGDDFDYDATYNVKGFLAYYKSSNGSVEQLQFCPNHIDKLLPYDFKVDGLCYKINDDRSTVSVTHESAKIYTNPPTPTYQDISGEIVIPEIVTYNGISYPVTCIDNSTFYRCSNITSVLIPTSVTSIGGSAFSYCNGLTSVTIPNSIKSIASSSFNNCNLLTAITLTGQGAWNLDNYNYSGLRNIINQFTTVNIACEISSLGDFGFNPNEVNCYAVNPPACTSGTFVNYDGQLHVPPVSTAAYFTANYWQNFVNMSNDLSYVTLDKAVANIVQWETATLTATVLPEECDVIWSSSDTDVATVDDNGKVTAISEGECDVFATIASTNGLAYAKCHVFVSYPDLQLSLSNENLEMNLTEERFLTVTIIPDNTGLTPTWTSSDESIAIVENGLVTAVGEGECDIIVSLLDKTATCHVTVSGNVTISLNVEYAIIGSNQILKVYPSCYPDVPVELVVTSSDQNVAIARIVNRSNANVLETLEEDMPLYYVEKMAEQVSSKSPTLVGEKAIMIVGVQNGTATITVTTTNDKSEPVNLNLRVVDVNGDRTITTTDVTCLYNYLLNGDETYIATSDVDGDGYITTTDITVIYNLLLGN